MIDQVMISGSVILGTSKAELTAHRVMDDLLNKAGLLSVSRFDYIVATGYGRLRLCFNGLFWHIESVGKR
jgi:hypothetical protein